MIYGAELSGGQNHSTVIRITQYLEQVNLTQREGDKVLIIHPETESGKKTAGLYERVLMGGVRISSEALNLALNSEPGRNPFKKMAARLEQEVIRKYFLTHPSMVIISPAEVLKKTLKHLKVNDYFRSHFCPSELLLQLTDGQLIHCDQQNKKIILI